jgi:hypothetical protein
VPKSKDPEPQKLDLPFTGSSIFHSPKEKAEVRGVWRGPVPERAEEESSEPRGSAQPTAAQLAAHHVNRSCSWAGVGLRLVDKLCLLSDHHCQHWKCKDLPGPPPFLSAGKAKMDLAQVSAW